VPDVALFAINGHTVTLIELLILLAIVSAVGILPTPLGQIGVALVVLWVLATLGDRWTTRILVLPDAKPIVTGPYRFVRHPNYLVVALEIPCVGLALGLRGHAALFGALDLARLRTRVLAENAAYFELGSAAGDDRSRS